MSKRDKIIALVFSVPLVLCLVVLLSWHFSGLGPASSDADRLYREAVALGVPLDAKDFAAATARPAALNNAPELTLALDNLLNAFRKMPAEDRREFGRYWQHNIDLNSSTQALISELSQELAQVRSKMTKPYFAPERDYSHPSLTLYPELANLGEFARLSGLDAHLLAKRGQRSDAVARLKSMINASSFSGDAPAILGWLVQSAILALTMRSIEKCSEADPGGIAEYSEAIDGYREQPIGVYFRADIAAILSALRNTSDVTLVRLALRNDEGGGEPYLKNTTSGPPQTPFARAIFSRVAARSMPLLRTFDRSGRIKDETAFVSACEKLSLAYNSDSDGIEFLDSIFSLPDTKRISVVRKITPTRVSLIKSFSRAVAFRYREGRWPKSLAEAGAAAIDPMNPNGGQLRYRVTEKDVRIWSVGRDGDDDSGKTRGELRVPGKPAEQINEDEVMTFRIAPRG